MWVYPHKNTRHLAHHLWRGIISPRNMVLDGLSREIHKKLTDHDISTSGVLTIRFANDIIIAGRSKETLDSALKVVKEFLSQRDLIIKE